MVFTYTRAIPSKSSWPKLIFDKVHSDTTHTLTLKYLHSPFLTSFEFMSKCNILGLALPKPPEGEGNGNPLQYSCLDNPRDGEAW